MTSTRDSLPSADQLPLFDLQWLTNLQPDASVTRLAGRAVTRTRSDRDGFNGRLLAGLTLVDPYEIPVIDVTSAVPEKLIAFSEAKSVRTPDPAAWVHFYEDDYRFEQLWDRPEHWFRRLEGFAGVISPDFSLYRNMPKAQQIFNTYRNQLLGARMQANGLNVIANVRLSGRSSIPYALAGTPSNATLALGLHGCTRDPANRRHAIEEVRTICDQLSPRNLVIYGSAAYGVLNYPLELGIPVHVFTPDTYTRSQSRKEAA